MRNELAYIAELFKQKQVLIVLAVLVLFLVLVAVFS